MRFVIGVLLVVTSIGWNREGHEIVARLASKHLSGDAERFVRYHLQLPDSTIESGLVLASTWADEIVDRRPDTGRFHFVHTPFHNCQPYNAERDCQDGECIVTAMTRFSEIATDLERPTLERTEAIKFLIHLMADIHQPLHVGFREDFGGNNIHLGSPALSLHEVWDRVPAIAPDSISSNGEMNSIDLSDSNSVALYMGSLATETSMQFTCKFAYMHFGGNWINSGDRLNEQYLNRQKVVAKLQLSKAAGRLVGLLNGLGKLYMARFSALHPPSPVTASVASLPEPAPSNRFLVLEGEFDEDDFIEAENAEPLSTSVVPVVPVRRARLPDIFENVDLNELVLTRDLYRNLIVTSRALRREARAQSWVFEVKFERNRSGLPVSFFFDSACFPVEPSTELVMRALSSIRGLPYTGAYSTPVIAMQLGIPLIGQSLASGVLFMVGGPRISEELLIRKLRNAAVALANSQSISSAFPPEHILNSVVQIRVEGLDWITTLDALNHAGPVHVSVLRGYSSKEAKARTILVDKRIHAGEITQEIFNTLIKRAVPNLKATSRAMAQFRSDIFNELTDLLNFFTGTDPHRWSQFKTINTILVIATGTSGRAHNELIWELHLPGSPIVRT